MSSSAFISADVDFATNATPKATQMVWMPRCFRSMLSQAWHNIKQSHEREHVTPYLEESGLFKLLSLKTNTTFLPSDGLSMNRQTSM